MPSALAWQICAHAIGPSRTLVTLTYARHDVFVSADKEVAPSNSC